MKPENILKDVKNKFSVLSEVSSDVCQLTGGGGSVLFS